MDLKLHKKNIIKSITTKDLFVYLIVLPFFSPNIFAINQSFQFLYWIFYYWRFAVIIIIALYTIKYLLFNHYKPDKFIIYIFFFYLIILLSTVINLGDLLSASKIISQTLAIMLFIDISMKFGKSKNVLLALRNVLFILVLANFFSVLFQPNLAITNDSSWVLGSKNNHIFSILPLIAVSLVYDINKRNKISLLTVFIILISLITVLINKSTTGLIIMIIASITLFLTSKFKNIKIFSSLYAYIISLVISIFFVFDISKYILMKLIVYLNKVDTFGRFEVWQKALFYIKNKIILGNGIEFQNIIISRLGYGQAHNKYLDVIYMGGIIAMMFFMLALTYLVIKLHKDMELKYSRVLSAFLITYFISFITESKRLDYDFYISAIVIINGLNNYKYLLHLKTKKEILEYVK